MKLDIYVGTLNRYYRKDWKVDNEQTSVKIEAIQGKNCFKNIKNSIKEEDTSKENIRQTIAEWMGLVAGTKPKPPTPYSLVRGG